LSKFEESKTFVTPPMKVAYVHLDKPAAMKGYDVQYYSVAAIFPNSKKKLYKDVFKQISDAFKAIETKLGIKDPVGFNGLFKDFKHEDFENYSMVNFKVHAFMKDGTPLASPEVYVQDKGDLKLIDSKQVQSGDYCAIGLSVMGQTINNRVTLKLKGIRLVQKGDPIRMDSTQEDMANAAKEQDDVAAFLGEDAKAFDIDSVTASPSKEAKAAEAEAASAKEEKPADVVEGKVKSKEEKPAKAEAEVEAISTEGNDDADFFFDD